MRIWGRKSSMSNHRDEEKKVRQKLALVFDQETETIVNILRFLDRKTNCQRGRPEEWSTLFDYLDNEPLFKRYAEDMARTNGPTSRHEEHHPTQHGLKKEAMDQSAVTESSFTPSSGAWSDFATAGEKIPEVAVLDECQPKRKFDGHEFNIALIGQKNSGQSPLICKLQKWCDLPAVQKNNKDGVTTAEPHELRSEVFHMLIWELPPIGLGHYSVEKYWDDHQIAKYNLVFLLMGDTFEDIHKDFIRFVSELSFPQPVIAITIAPAETKKVLTVNAATQFSNKYQFSNCTACAVSIMADLKKPEAFLLDEHEFLARMEMYYEQYQAVKGIQHFSADDNHSLPAQ